MKLYPVYLKLKNINCLVIGGGNVALRKVKTLIACGAKVSVLSPKLCRGLELLKGKKAFKYRRGAYQKKFLKDVFLVIAATDEIRKNAQVAYDAQAKGLLINVVDNPGFCNFYVPAVVRKEPLLASVATGGMFPGLAKKIRLEFSPILSKYAKNIKVLAKLRDEIKREFKNKNVRARNIKKLLNADVLKLIEKKKIKSLNEFKTRCNIR